MATLYFNVDGLRSSLCPGQRTVCLGSAMHRANNSPLKRFHRSPGNPGPLALRQPSFLHLFQSLLTSVFLFSRAPFPLAPKIAHVIASTFSRKAANKSTSNDPFVRSFVQSTGHDGVRDSRNSFVVFEETGLDSRCSHCSTINSLDDEHFVCRS